MIQQREKSVLGLPRHLSLFEDGAIEPYRIPVALEPARRIDLLAHLSGAFDLAEGQPVGHSVRVAHLALAFAKRLRLDAATRRRTLHTALLHDAGVAVRYLPESIDIAGGHTAAGAWIASLMGFGQEVQFAIRSTHERWDGEGRPKRLVMTDIPIEALLVSAAHWVCDMLAPEEHPLRARSALRHVTPDDLEPLVGLRVGRAVVQELRSDAVWMSFWDEALPSLVAHDAPAEGRPSHQQVDRVAEAMGEVVDSAVREPGRAQKVAALAAELGHQLGLDAQYCRALRIAALLIDIGQLGVLRHITEKPAILSVEEMEQMQRHPGWAARLLEDIPGFGEIAGWVEQHHERMDGRGYPDQRPPEELPLAARILAVADTYAALCAERPYRPALDPDAAAAIIEGASGIQYDPLVVACLQPALAAVAAQRSATRAA